MLPHPAAAARSLQACPTLGDPTDGSPPGSPVPGILQARGLEWGATAFSRATREAHNKLVSISKYFSESCELFYQITQIQGPNCGDL